MPSSSSHSRTPSAPYSTTTSTPAAAARSCQPTCTGLSLPSARLSSTSQIRPSHTTRRSGTPASVGASFTHSPPASVTCRRSSASTSRSRGVSVLMQTRLHPHTAVGVCQTLGRYLPRSHRGSSSCACSRSWSQVQSSSQYRSNRTSTAAKNFSSNTGSNQDAEVGRTRTSPRLL